MTHDRLSQLQRDYHPDMAADDLHDWAQDLLTALRERPSAGDRLASGLNEDAATLLLLGHIERDTCLQGHGSYDPARLSVTLGVDARTLELAQQRAAAQRLTTTEQAWTGSWRRVILTPDGRARLKALRASFGHLLTGPAAPRQAPLFGMGA